MTIVIVGAGTAAISCAREIRKLNQQVSIRLVSADAADVYSKPMLSNALAKQMSPAALVTSGAEKLSETLNATIDNHVKVECINVASKTLETAGDSIHFDQLVLAVGANQRDPGLDNPQQVTIHKINHLEDYVVFRQALASVKHVLIVGAGLIGCEFANDLLSAGYQCTVIAPSQYPLSNLLPDAAAAYFMKALAKQGVQWRMGVRAQSVSQSGAKITLHLDDQTQVQGDVILSAVGLKANTELAQSANLDIHRGIVVDNYLRSSNPDIYALGDCAEVDGQFLPFILPIMYGARALAATFNGNPTKVNYPLMPVVVKTPACPLCILPPPQIEGEWEIQDQEEGLSALYRDSAGAIQGFALLGSATAQRQYIIKQMMAT